MNVTELMQPDSALVYLCIASKSHALYLRYQNICYVCCNTLDAYCPGAASLQTGKTKLRCEVSITVVTGASGGAATAHWPIAPQFIPISQLVLMTMKVVHELKTE